MNVLSQFSSPGKSIEVLTDDTPSEAPKTSAPKAETKKEEKKEAAVPTESNDNLDDFIAGLDL